MKKHSNKTFRILHQRIGCLASFKKRSWAVAGSWRQGHLPTTDSGSDIDVVVQVRTAGRVIRKSDPRQALCLSAVECGK